MCYSYGGLPSNRRAAVPSRRESTGVGLPWWGETRAESTGVDRNRQESSCAPSHPRVDSVPPLSRCPRAPRSAWANSTPVDSCRLLSIRLGDGLARNSTPVDSCRFVPSRGPLSYSSFAYRQSDCYVLGTIIELETLSFCRAFLDFKNDPKGRQYDQIR